MYKKRKYVNKCLATYEIVTASYTKPFISSEASQNVLQREYNEILLLSLQLLLD